MDREYASIDRNGVWVEETVPDGVHLIGSKWVYKRKMNSAGIVIKFKARVVAQGFTQVEGLDFDDAYSPVSSLASLRVLLAIAAAEKLFSVPDGCRYRFFERYPQRNNLHEVSTWVQAPNSDCHRASVSSLAVRSQAITSGLVDAAEHIPSINRLQAP